jgi:hypothetical protein
MILPLTAIGIMLIQEPLKRDEIAGSAVAVASRARMVRFA